VSGRRGVGLGDERGKPGGHAVGEAVPEPV